MEIKIKNDISKLSELLDEFQVRSLAKATRMAMNRSVISLRSQANKIAREERKLKASTINNKYFEVEQARGNDLSTMSASLKVSSKPMSMIEFLSGPQERFSQKGLKVSERRKVRVEVKPGRKVELAGAFVAMGKGGNFHVFRRKGKTRHPIAKQSAPSMAVVLQRKIHRDALEGFAKEKFFAEFQHAMEFESQKLRDKFDQRNMSHES